MRGWISKNIERYRDFGFGLWAVVLKETGGMIGDCGITMQCINGRIKPEIGYAREAARACRDWAFEHEGRQRALDRRGEGERYAAG